MHRVFYMVICLHIPPAKHPFRLFRAYLYRLIMTMWFLTWFGRLGINFKLQGCRSALYGCASSFREYTLSKWFVLLLKLKGCLPLKINGWVPYLQNELRLISGGLQPGGVLFNALPVRKSPQNRNPLSLLY